jgi:hypothetical protein
MAPPDTPFFHTHGEGLLQFPSGVFIHHQLWLPDGLARDFNKSALFDRLIRSRVYKHQRLGHSFEGSHGPFAVARIRPDHYEPLSAEAVQQILHTRLVPDSTEDLARYRDPWPSVEALQRRLSALLTYIDAERLHWYRLAIDLDDEQYWSDGYREVPILDHFEEWVAVNPRGATIYMLQVIQD